VRPAGPRRCQSWRGESPAPDRRAQLSRCVLTMPTHRGERPPVR
jgi:hypothetical protein